MPEKVGFREKIEKNRKLQVLFFCVSMSLLVLLYLLMVHQIKNKIAKEDLKNIELCIDYDVLLNLESMDLDSKNIRLFGWIGRYDTKIEKISIILQDTYDSDKQYIVLDIDKEGPLTVYSDKQKIDQYEFELLLNKKDIDINACYEVLFSIEYYDEESDSEENIKISSNRFFYNGNLYKYSPNDFIRPNVTDAGIEDVIEKGEVYFFDSSKTIWVYKYQEKMYAIIDYKILGDFEQRPEILFHIYSLSMNSNESEESLLECKTNNYFLQEKDYEEKSDSNYLIYILDIPEDKKVAYYQFGIYHNSGEQKGFRCKTSFREELRLFSICVCF